MSKFKTSVLNIIIIILLVTSMVPVYAGEKEIPKMIRIGLTTKYFNVPKISIYNKELTLGYIDDTGERSIEAIITEGKYYRIEALDKCFLVSRKSYKDYDDAKQICSELRNSNYPAYPGIQGRGVWKIYMGRYSDANQAKQVMKDMSQKVKQYQFTVEEDNKLRYKIATDNAPVIIVDAKDNYPSIAVENEDCIDLGDRKYRGNIEFARYDKTGMSAVNIISIEEYLRGVVPCEVPATWPMDALKAQAVAARTFALYNIVQQPKYKDKPYDLNDTVNSQVYKGYGVEQESTTIAVLATQGEVIYQGKNIICSFFYSTSGGHTEEGQNVWGSSVPYVKAVPDIYELQPEKPPWIKMLTATEIQEILLKNKVDIGEVKDLQITEYTDSGRAMGIMIKGSKGKFELTKEYIKRWFSLYSRKFTLIKTQDYKPTVQIFDNKSKSINTYLSTTYIMSGNDKSSKVSFTEGQVVAIGNDNLQNYAKISAPKQTYVFAGMGNGHGVGLSQSGAKCMALEGFNYKDIITHYYHNISINKLY